MVYIQSWQEYQEAAEALYAKSPNKARYCVKWKPSEGRLVLKITDDTTCLKYKTHSSIYLNRFEALNLSLMQKMQNRRPPPPSMAHTAPSSAMPTRLGTPKLGAGSHEHSRASSPALPGTPGKDAMQVDEASGASGGGAKKKKAKKRK